MTDTPAFGTWMPIETAPKDGTSVILFWPYITQDGFVSSGQWFSGHYDVETGARGNGYWYSWNVNSGATPPTHWMPLPPPPEGK